MSSPGTGNVPPGNAILNRWRHVLAGRAAEAALFSAAGERLRTFADIDAEAGDLPDPIAAIEPGSVAGIRIGNDVRWPALLLSLFRHGVIPMPLGTHMEEQEVGAALATCGARALIECDGSRLVCRRMANAGPQWSGPPPDFLKLTSGTTAAPRAIRFRAEQLVADCDNVCETMGIGSEDLNFGVIPFSHSYGFSNLITPLLCRGVPLVVSEDRMPRAILDGLAASVATVLPATPVIYQALVQIEDARLPESLRLCISAGAPLTRTVAEIFTASFALKLHTFYGSSECGGIGYDRSDAHEYEEGFAGTPMENVRVTPLDPAGGLSSVVVESDAVGDGYFPVADPEVLGGCRFIPADLVRFSDRGMFIEGRSSDMINVAGRKLNPAEIESRLAAFPGVRQVVVFGIPSRLRNEEPVACVTGESSLTAEAIMQFAREELSSWQVPRDIWLVPEIPANDRGKTSRRDLARRYLEHVAGTAL